MSRSPSLPVGRDTWRGPIGPALLIIETLQEAGHGPLCFRIGGGTVLMFRFDHRLGGHHLSNDREGFTAPGCRNG